MKDKDRKKTISSMLILILMVTLFAGCGDEAEEKYTSTKISIWCYWEMESNRQTMNTLAADYNSIQDEVEIDVEYIPDEDFKKKLTLGIVDKDMPDMAVVDTSDFAYLNSLEEFVDLTDEIPELAEYMPIATEPCTVNGRIYGVPVGLNCPVLFYNKRMLEESGLQPPVTLEEFVDTARALTSESVRGFGINALQSEECTFMFLPLLWSNGGDIHSINSSESKEVFQAFRTLRETGVLNDFAENFTQQDITRQFQEENIAMMFNSNICLNALRRETPDLEFGIASVPHNKTEITVVGGEIFGVLPGENQDACVAFLRYLTDKNRIKEYLDEFGFLAPREDVLKTQYQADEIGQEFIRIFSTARRRENTTAWPEMSKVIMEAVQDSIHINKSVDEIAETAAKKITGIREGEK